MLPPRHPRPRPRTSRRLRGTLALVATAGLLTGCTPDPTPTPTPTPIFATDDDAFTAAEQGYREYNDASNDARTPGSDAKPQSFLVGSALEGFLHGQDLLKRNGVHLAGNAKITSFIREDADITPTAATVTITVCIDITETRVVDDAGQDVTPIERPDLVAQRVTMVGDAKSFLIESEAEGDRASCTAH